MSNEGLDFLISKANLRETKIERKPASQKTDLKAGEIVVKVESFGLTANNITYAAFGEKLSYWNFFPTESKEWGHLPVWGFASVLYSKHDEVKEGERLFGYWPLASHCFLSPQKVSAKGFTDGAPHRQELPLIYNQYILTAGNPTYSKEDDDKETIFRPLFLTSFFLDDYLFDKAFFGAQQIIIASASSKTAVSLAYLLNENRHGQFEIIALTSNANISFVKSLYCYDRVIDYGALSGIDATLPTVYVDMAGNASLLSAVHQKFKENLKASVTVGASHWESLGKAEELPGPKPEFFFAPTQIRKRSSDWGVGGIDDNFLAVWPGFLSWLDRWFEIEHFKGAAGLEEAYRKVLEGKAAPQRGFVVSI